MKAINGYDILVVPHTDYPSGGPWLIRCYDAKTNEHIHSAEGGVSLSVGMREVEEAIERHQESLR